MTFFINMGMTSPLEPRGSTGGSGCLPSKNGIKQELCHLINSIVTNYHESIISTLKNVEKVELQTTNRKNAALFHGFTATIKHLKPLVSKVSTINSIQTKNFIHSTLHNTSSGH